MQYKIINEQPWQILTDAMTISPSETGYELQVAADGKNYTTLFSVGPGITRQITNLSSGSYFRMKGNVGEVTVNWVRSCNSGGSGGGGNAGELEPVSEFPVGVPEGTVVALASGDTVGVYQYDGSEWIPVAGGDMSNYYTKAQTDAAITAATEDMATKTWVGQQGYLTEHQDISGKLDVSTFNTYTGATETVLEGKADISDIPDVSNFVTSGEVATQIGTAMSSETARTENTYAKIADIPSLDGYWTSAQTNNAITAATNPIQNQLDDVERVTATALTSLQESKQETLVSGTNIKTINDQSLLGSGNIDIQGGGGGGGSVVELTKAQYDALDPPAQDTTYIITDADIVDLNDYAPASGLTALETATTASLATKADKQNVTARASNSNYLPGWNAQGVITGSTAYYNKSQGINGTNYNVFSNSNTNHPAIYAPTSAGTAGQPLLSNGSGAPVWGGYKFAFITQTAYDALATKDSTTIYFIVGE